MTTPNQKEEEIFDRIAREKKCTKDDIEILRQSEAEGSINIGNILQGEGEITITGRVYQGADAETIRKVLKESFSESLQRERYSRGTIISGGFLAWFIIFGVRVFLGGLQYFELGVYDFFVQSRSKTLDQNILIVEVTEADVTAQIIRNETVPVDSSLSNETLNRLLEKLDEFEPRAIGLDLYRPNTEPDAALRQRFENQNNLFAVCKVQERDSQNNVITPDIPPPPGFPENRVGFSDFVKDRDGILRRHLLAFDADTEVIDDESKCRANFSFNLLLANHYLKNPIAPEVKPIEYKSSLSPNNRHESCHDLQFTNNVKFPNLRLYTGGYQGQENIFGCQVLLNYRGKKTAFESFTVEAILNGEVSPSLYKDKKPIILVGVTRRDGVRDYWNTPYNTSYPFNNSSGEQMAGVVVQAQMVSQILDVVLGERWLIWVLPAWVESLGILSFALIGGGVIGRERFLFWVDLPDWVTTFALVISLPIVCFLVFQICNGWLPLIPLLLALLVAPHFCKLVSSMTFVQRLDKFLNSES